MVKILQAYSFAKQNTFALSGEILSATLIDSNLIAVCSSESFIEIYDVDNTQRVSTTHLGGIGESFENVESDARDERYPAKYTLATVGEVVNLIYCDTGKYLLTLEKENVGSPVHSNGTSIGCTSSSSNMAFSDDDIKMFVRIYANFRKFPEVKLIDLPITIRIASMTTPKAPLIESIDVIELPLRSPPELIQCCQTSGNVIVSSKERIYLYEYVQCMHESTQPRFSYIDFLPFKFFVNLNFTPIEICLAENVIACLNNRYCIAFKIVDVIGNVAINNDYNDLTIGDGGGGLNVENDNDESISTTESSIASKTSAGQTSHNSFEADSLETITSTGRNIDGIARFRGRTPIDFNVARIINSAYGREFEIDLKSQWEQDDLLNTSTYANSDTQDIIIGPARANDIKIKLVNEAKAMNVQQLCNQSGAAFCYQEEQTVQYDIRKLLQICMKTSEPNGRIVNILRCMDLKAIYQRKNLNAQTDDEEYDDVGNQQIPSAVTRSKNLNRRSLKSHNHQSCIAYTLLVASNVDGYLYQFSAKGKWYNENEKPIATYSFTAPVLKVHINDYTIYAITAESIEVATTRIGHKLFNNRFEYPTIGNIFPEESNPDLNAPIAVIGLCSFLHLQHVCVNCDNLVVISNSSAASFETNKSTTGNTEAKRGIAARLLAAKQNFLRNGYNNPNIVPNEWTLYNLEIPQIENVIDDLEAIAESYRSASSTEFYDLLEEAHLMLRLSLVLQMQKMNTEREQKLKKKFINNCRKLADFAIRSNKKEIYLQANGFYKICDINLPTIYESYVTNNVENDAEELKADDFIGLIYTVKVYLSNLGTDRLKATFLNQTVKPYFTPKRSVEQGLTQISLSVEFLNMFIRFSAADIPQIMLSSPVVADTISGEIINYLKYLDKLSPDEILLMAVTGCRMSNYLLSQEIVSRSSRRDLALALIKHKNVLFDDGTVLFQKQNSEGKVYARTNVGHTKTKTRRSQNRKATILRTDSTISPQPSSQAINVVSFSEFTETILLALEQPELIEAISDAFIHALCIEHSLSLEIVLQLFLNYIATHIGHKGYQTSQKVFVNILQVYYYDIFDVNHANNFIDLQSNNLPNIEDDYEDNSKAISLNSEQSNESAVYSIEDTKSTGSSNDDKRKNRIVYDNLHEQSLESNINQFSNNLDIMTEEMNLKGLKILFRMYMGRLKSLSDLMTDLQSADIEQQKQTSDNFTSLRIECIKFMMQYLHDLRGHQIADGYNYYYYYSKTSQARVINRTKQNRTEVQEHEKNLIFIPFIPDYKLSVGDFNKHIEKYVRPIPCLLDRPQYLNKLKPFKPNDFSVRNKDEGETTIRFLGWNNELLTLILKIQSLLASPKISREIIEEFIAFIQKTPNIIGIDSFLVIILPKNLAINFMLNFCPEHMWQYGKSNSFMPKHWESLLRKMLSKQTTLTNWKSHINEILNNLIIDLSFEDLLQCFPNEIMQNRDAQIYVKELAHAKERKDNSIKFQRNHSPMDNIDENNVFEMALRKAVAKQRSDALRSMVESTGKQLFDATNNPMYNL